MIHNLRFRSKLTLVVAAPIVALLAVTIPGVLNRVDAIRAASQYSTLAKPVDAIGRVTAALEEEGALSDWYLASAGTSATDKLAQARKVTDTAVHGMRATVADLDPGGASVATRNRFVDLLGTLAKLKLERQSIDQRVTPIDVATNYYQDGASRAVSALDGMSRDVKSSKLAASLRDYATVLQVTVAGGQERSLVLVGIVTGWLPTPLANDVVASVTAQDSVLRTFRTQTSASVRKTFDTVTGPSSGATAQVTAVRQQALAGTLYPAAPANWNELVQGGSFAASPLPANATSWYQSSGARIGFLSQGAQAIADETKAVAAHERTLARARAVQFGGGALLALLVALLVALIVGRTVTGPLRRLTKAADDVAHDQLPQLLEALHSRGAETHIEQMEPIPVGSRDEIGELARAFNSLEAATVNVAREQAVLLRKGIGDLYVNLARRNQSLIDRQIALIDDLEAHEQDPEILASLFKLDHMATRMRRNAESLLVLADTDQVRPTGPAEDLIDVVRAAASEITDFARISFVGVDEHLSVQGGAALDVTHLVAELLENATTYSPPDSQVTIRGTWDGDGYRMAIADDGIGMSDDRMAEANALLAHPPAPGLALARSLGLYVVGHLAARWNIVVQLEPSAPRGATALVTLPPALLVDGLGRHAADALITLEHDAPSAARLVEAATGPEERPPIDAMSQAAGAIAQAVGPRVEDAPRIAPPEYIELPGSMEPPPMPASRPEPVAEASDLVHDLSTSGPDELTLEEYLAQPRPAALAELARSIEPPPELPPKPVAEAEPPAAGVTPSPTLGDDLLPRRERGASFAARSARARRLRARHRGGAVDEPATFDAGASASATSAMHDSIAPPVAAAPAPPPFSTAEEPAAGDRPEISLGAGLTQSGLVQRVPGSRLTHRPVASYRVLPPAVSTSPHQARSLLSEFAAGMRRGGRVPTTDESEPPDAATGNADQDATAMSGDDLAVLPEDHR